MKEDKRMKTQEEILKRNEEKTSLVLKKILLKSIDNSKKLKK